MLWSTGNNLFSRTSVKIAFVILIFLTIFPGFVYACGASGQYPCQYCKRYGTWHGGCAELSDPTCNQGFVIDKGVCRLKSKPLTPAVPANVGLLKTSVEVKEINGDISSKNNGVIDIKNVKGFVATIYQPRGAEFHVANSQNKKTACANTKNYFDFFSEFCPANDNNNIPFCESIQPLKYGLDCDPSRNSGRTKYTCSDLGLKDGVGNSVLYPLRTLEQWRMFSTVPMGDYVMVNANWFDVQGPAGVADFKYPYIMPCTDIYGLSVDDGEVVSSHTNREPYANEALDAFVVMDDDSGLYPYVLSLKSNQELTQMKVDEFKKIRYAVSGFIIAKNGQVVSKLPKTGKPNGKAARTILALSNNGNRMYLAVFQPGVISGDDGMLTMTEAAQYMINNWKAQDVLILDGGGSSQFIYSLGGDQNYHYISLPGGKNVKGEIAYRPVANFLTVGLISSGLEKRSVSESPIMQFEHIGQYYSNDPYLYDGSSYTDVKGTKEDCAEQCLDFKDCTYFTYSYANSDKICTLFGGEINKMATESDYQLYKRK